MLLVIMDKLLFSFPNFIHPLVEYATAPSDQFSSRRCTFEIIDITLRVLVFCSVYSTLWAKVVIKNM